MTGTGQRRTALRTLWVYSSLLAAVGCAACFAYILIRRPVGPEARLVLEVMAVVGALVGFSTVGSVLGGRRLLEEDDAAEPLSLKEAGWLLGVPPGLVIALWLILFSVRLPGQTYLQAYVFPFIVSGAFCALVWALLARAVAREAGLRLSDYACGLFIEPPEAYPSLARRKQAWRLVRRRALPTLEQARAYLPEVVPALAHRLGQARAESESNLLLALLSDLGDASVAPALLQALQGNQPRQRRTAAVALGKLGVHDAAPALAQLTLEDPEALVRRSAVVALGKLQAPETLPALQAALHDKDAGVRQSACVAVGKLGLESSRVLLEGCLQDTSEGVRKSAAKALERLGRDMGATEAGEE